MRNSMLPSFGRGKELQDLLRKELGVPEMCKWFEVRFSIGEFVTVRCEYIADEEKTDGTLARASQ